MRTSEIKSKAILKAAALVAAILLFGVGASFAQQTINLTAAPTTVTLPDGSVVPQDVVLLVPVQVPNVARVVASGPR